MRKKVKFILIALVGISAFAFLIIFNFDSYKKPDSLESVEDISLFVDYNNGTIKTRTNFSLDNSKTTALDALEKWCIIRYEDFGWGIIVREIDGVSGNWIYIINSFSPSVGASAYPLESGDLVTWKHV